MKNEALHCLKCNHAWTSRLDKKPVQCPFCKSVKWNEAKHPKLIKHVEPQPSMDRMKPEGPDSSVNVGLKAAVDAFGGE